MNKISLLICAALVVMASLEVRGAAPKGRTQPGQANADSKSMNDRCQGYITINSIILCLENCQIRGNNVNCQNISDMHPKIPEPTTSPGLKCQESPVVGSICGDCVLNEHGALCHGCGIGPFGAFCGTNCQCNASGCSCGLQ